mgnify:CR=1 FL=1
MLKLNYLLLRLNKLLLTKQTLILFNHKEFIMKDNLIMLLGELLADLVSMKNTRGNNTHQKWDLIKNLEFKHLIFF